MGEEMNSKTLIILAAGMMLASCAKNNDTVANPADASETATIKETVESAITTISGIMDEQEQETFLSGNKKMNRHTASSSTCNQRAAGEVCASGNKTINYPDCLLANTAYKISGMVALAYSSTDCLLSATGSSVTRTHDITLKDTEEKIIKRYTTANTDYRNNAVSGGSRLKKTAGDYQLDILGVTKAMTDKGKAVYNISTRTLAAVTITGGLQRISRVMNGGSIEVSHNLAKNHVTFVPKQVKWSTNCCYPTSGGLDFTLNKLDAECKGTVTFNGCGSASVNVTSGKYAGAASITLANCE